MTGASTTSYEEAKLFLIAGGGSPGSHLPS